MFKLPQNGVGYQSFLQSLATIRWLPTVAWFALLWIGRIPTVYEELLFWLAIKKNRRSNKMDEEKEPKNGKVYDINKTWCVVFGPLSNLLIIIL